ncbi:MAG TPA: RdgB/HAM1 family non-canonical purine NTP pyrophosphatase [Candidatus Saccharimonadales bacterium]|nr:RdgB/HAM1 family non-canonical purine NTP pyrophosphatase [Candidatus Saccharimonadales bacterium]
MTDITLITGNAGKIAEISRLLGIEVHGQKVSLPELQATDVREVARAKAQAAYDQLQRPVLVDDTGLYINAWGELPGALIAWFLDNVGCDGVLKMLEGWDDRSARVVTALGYCDENGVQIFDGELTGSIATELRGENGFGYDPIFVPEGSSKTFAEHTSEQKDAISMRALAAAKLKDFITQA